MTVLRQVIQLQSDVHHLQELPHEHLGARELYRSNPDVWRLIHLNYRSQLEHAETRLADLVRRDGKEGAPQVLQPTP